MKTVPDVVGKSQDDASEGPTDAGLALGAITDAYLRTFHKTGHSQSQATGSAGTRQRCRRGAVEGPRAPHRSVAER